MWDNVCMCRGQCTCMWNAHVCEGQWSALTFIPQEPSTLLFSAMVSSWPEVHPCVRQVGHWAPEMFPSPCSCYWLSHLPSCILDLVISEVSVCSARLWFGSVLLRSTDQTQLPTPPKKLHRKPLLFMPAAGERNATHIVSSLELWFRRAWRWPCLKCWLMLEQQTLNVHQAGRSLDENKALLECTRLLNSWARPSCKLFTHICPWATIYSSV